MAKVYAMIANGTEEVECLAVVDLLRRSGVETVLVSVEESCEVTSSHKVRITADTTLAQTDLSDGDVIFLPGGMPGAERLSACEPLVEALEQADREGRRIAAICAAPGVVLGRHGPAEGENGYLLPGLRKRVPGWLLYPSGSGDGRQSHHGPGVGVCRGSGAYAGGATAGQRGAEDTRRRIQYT